MFKVIVTVKVQNGEFVTYEQRNIPSSVAKDRYDLCGLIARGLLFSKGLSHPLSWEWDVVSMENL